MKQQLLQQLRVLSNQRWRQYAIETLVRTTGAGLILVCFGLILPVVGLPTLPRPFLGWLVVGGVLFGCVRALTFRLSPSNAARRLDRRFRLHEMLSTAVEWSGEQQGVAGYLQNHAQEMVTRIQYYVNQKRQPLWPDALMLGAFLLMIAGLLVLVSSPNAPVGVAEPLPELNRPDPVAQPPQPDPSSPTGNDAGSVNSGDPRALSALADALRDQSITRPAAEALDRGDIAGAAEALRELADQVDNVSPAARDSLGEALREAARAVDQSLPDLADQLRATADALQFGDAMAGAVGLEALADALEQMPTQTQMAAEGAGGGAGNSPGSQRREQPFTPLGLDGTPLELSTNGSGQIPTTGDTNRPPTGTQSGRLPIRSSSTTGGGIVQTADDPLRIPTDVRDVVRDYFSP